jgi:molybdate transport system regulatory protein
MAAYDFLPGAHPMSMEKDDAAIELDGSVWMTVGGENFGGAGRVTLLAAIAERGSITKAAKSINMSYKAAWDAVDNMNNLAGEPLVERVSGGKGGGGTRLTRRGAQLVANFKLIEREHRNFVEQLSRQAEGIADDFLLIRRMNMKTSARNQFLGTVAQVKRGAVNDEIELEVAGGQKIVATITRESTEDLGLQPGVQAIAMIKASSIILVIDDANAKFSARNRMAGIVSRVQTGAVNSEVVIELDGGGAIAAIITNESCNTLGLAVGARAAGIFKASSVVLGVAA